MDIPSSNVSKFGLPFFKTHPSNRNYIIAVETACYAISSGSENVYGPPKAHFPKCKSVLLFSKDSGKTFVEITPPGHDSLREGFDGFSCHFMRGKRASQQNDDSTFLCQTYKLNFTFGVPNNPILFSVSNLGKTTNKMDHFNRLIGYTINFLESYTIIATREDRNYYNSAKRIWVSDDGLNFQEAHFPPQASNFSYFSTPTEIDGRIFIILYTQKRGFFEKDGYETYVSDSTGFNFTKLAPLISKHEGWREFTTIDNLKGTIIQTFEADKSLFRKQETHAKISLDNGKSWPNLRIKDPENKESYSCDVDEDENCSLNTRGPFSSRNRRNRFDRTLGILTTVGSVSTSKVFDCDNQQTCISRDGDISWSKIFDFPAKVEFGDLGNIIVAVPDHQVSPEETIVPYYSLDQGYTWSELPFEGRSLPYSFSMLANDDSSSTFTMVTYPSMFQSTSTKKYTYVFDFGKAFGGRTCSESDFEDWYQSNGECVNGARYKFKRRKHDAQCLVKKSFADIERVEEPCACTKKDYECSPGFSSNKEGDRVLDYSLLDSSKVCDGSVDTLHLAPTVLTAGNKCWNPLAIDLVEVSCKELGIWKSKRKTRENTFNLETCVSWLRSLLSVWFP